MATHAYGDSKRPYMAKLPEESVRILPPNYTDRDTSSRFRPKETKADILKLYGLGQDHHEYVRQRKEQNRPKEWKDSDIQDVVKYYLKAATVGGNPSEPQPSVMCECCMDINNHNKIQRKTLPLQPDSTLKTDHAKPGSRPPSPEEKPDSELTASKGPKQVRFVGMGDKQPVIPAIPFYRSEHDGPELTTRGSYSSRAPSKDALEEYDNFVADNKKLFVTYPVKRSLYSNWGINEELSGYGRDRYMAEDVVEASSKYLDSMQRLKKYTD